MDQIKPIIYERVIFIKKMPYWIFWPLVAIISFIFGYGLLFFTGENIYHFTLLIFCSYIGLFQPILIWGSHSFQSRLNNLSNIFWEDTQEFNNWYIQTHKKIFLIESFQAKLLISFILIMGIFTIILLGLPFDCVYVNIIAIIWFSYVLFFSGHCAYVFIAFLFTLHEVVAKTPHLPFFQFSHPAIVDFQNLYLATSILVTSGYFTLIIAIMMGPYGLINELQLWLSILAVYPILLFSWTYLESHKLRRIIKFQHIETINYKVQGVLKKVDENCNMIEIEKLEKVMDIQNKVQLVSEWPFNLQGIGTFIIALATAIVQIITILNSG
jgi:hypothetical protein